MKILISRYSSRIFLIAVFLLGSFSFLFFDVHAQSAEPKFLFTWKAQSYTPAGFLGKVLPTDNSLITVSFEIISQGKIADLSKNDIYWYVNDDFFEEGMGLKEIAFRASGVGKQEARIQVNDYSGQTLLENFVISSVKPEVVMVAPFSGGRASATQVKIQAQPYFFNVRRLDELEFGWGVNGQSPKSSGDPSWLNITFKQLPSSGTTINVVLNVKNPRNIFEIASKEKTLQF